MDIPASAQKGVKPDPRLLYDFVSATHKDLGKMVDLCCSDFIKVEPHSRALGLTDKDTRYLFEWIIGKSLHYPYCLTVVEKATSRLVGLRAVSMGHRDHSLDWEPFELRIDKLPENVVKLAAVLGGSKAAFWEVVDPSITKVMRREISFIVADHQRKGIAKAMAELNFDYDQMRADGIQGIVSEASSLANQTLLQNAGYKFLCEPEKYDWAKNIDDGTTGIKVFFKDLRSEDTSSTDRLYELVAAVVHCGATPNRGHYITLVKSSNCWLLFDVDIVDKMDISSMEDFFGLTDSGTAAVQKSNSESAYIHFYQARDAPISSIRPSGSGPVSV